MLLAHAEPVAFFGEGQAAPLVFGDGWAAPCGDVLTWVHVHGKHCNVLLARAEPVAFFGEGQASPLFYGDGLAAPCGHAWTPSLLVMLLQRAPALRSLAVEGCPALASGAPVCKPGLGSRDRD